jgi:hypothetical protein
MGLPPTFRLISRRDDRRPIPEFLRAKAKAAASDDAGLRHAAQHLHACETAFDAAEERQRRQDNYHGTPQRQAGIGEKLANAKQNNPADNISEGNCISIYSPADPVD